MACTLATNFIFDSLPANEQFSVGSCNGINSDDSTPGKVHLLINCAIIPVFVTDNRRLSGILNKIEPFIINHLLTYEWHDFIGFT